ncbi:hypothetical protein XENOCAPTIV_023726, partial [Xenoophorus captivus]
AQAILCDTHKPRETMLGEYTLWFMVRGVEKGEEIARTPTQSLTLSEAVGVYARLNRDFAISEH